MAGHHGTAGVSLRDGSWIKIKKSLSRSRFKGGSRGRGRRAAVAEVARAQCRGIIAIPVEDQALKPVQPHPQRQQEPSRWSLPDGSRSRNRSVKRRRKPTSK